LTYFTTFVVDNFTIGVPLVLFVVDNSIIKSLCDISIAPTGRSMLLCPLKIHRMKIL
jgi:hypothetical protein